MLSSKSCVAKIRADRQHNAGGQINQRRKRDHAATERPQRPEPNPSELKGPEGAYDEGVEENEPKPARQQKSHLAGNRLSEPSSVQERRNSSEQREGWRAVVGDEAREVERRAGVR